MGSDTEDRSNCVGSGSRKYSFQAECCRFPVVCGSRDLDSSGDRREDAVRASSALYLGFEVLEMKNPDPLTVLDKHCTSGGTSPASNSFKMFQFTSFF